MPSAVRASILATLFIGASAPGSTLAAGAAVGSAAASGERSHVAAPSTAAAATEAARSCWGWGARLEAGGPRAFGGVAVTHAPTCALELSLGVDGRYRQFTTDVERLDRSLTARGYQLGVPFRARLWSHRLHALLLDAGAGPSFTGVRTDIDGERWRMQLRAIQGSLGIGYGYRGKGPWRFSALVGVSAALPTGWTDNEYQELEVHTYQAFHPAPWGELALSHWL